MLPVVRGDETARQVLLYTVLLVGLTLVPVLTGPSAGSTWSPPWCSAPSSSGLPCGSGG